ncbi:MAG: hypothetical protein K0V04_20235 [Deltaproteobacteria bacterium]|nr:hypothetical protein [Deltaproteobacteria bacterium]
MTPEVLIVGDAARRTDLADRIRALGYDGALCTAEALAQRVGRGLIPAAVVACTEDVDTGRLMTELRRTRRGSGVPVTLYGPLDGTIGDLADVLDLGADHFLEDPATDEQLVAALEELVGPGGNPVAEASGPHHAADPSGSGTHDVVATDAVMGQLHRTLDMLEARLRDHESVDGDDDLDLTALGFDALPPLDEGDSAQDPSSSLELPISRPAQAPANRGGQRREPTERLGAEPSPRTSGTGASIATGSAVAPAPTNSLPVELHGELERMEVPRLLWVLHRAGYGGGLTLTRARVSKHLGWSGGQVVQADSNVVHDQLVHGLLRRGLLTREQYEPAAALVAEAPETAGPRLVEAGMLKPAELPRVLREHLVRIVGSTFAWPEGTWTLDPTAHYGDPAPGLPTVATLLAAGVRARMDGARLLALLGGLDRHPVVAPEVRAGASALAEALELTPPEEGFILRLDGGTSLRQLMADLPAEQAELLGLVYTLQVQGHLRLADHGTVAAEVDPAALDVARIRDRLHMSREADYFEVLGLSHDAERVEVRRAHAQLHETFADDSLEPAVRESMQGQVQELRDLLDEARDVLDDDGLRSAYLAHLEES